MKNIIATWICIDDESNATYFPSAKGNSSDTAVQQVYWRCICTFFWSARYHNPDAHLVLFSNQGQLPPLNGISVKDVLKKLGVQFYVTPFEYITPPGYFGKWRNQFYEFSIFKFISNHADFSDDDLFMLVDSDCIITGDLLPLFQTLNKERCITYEINYDIHVKVNGNSRADMKLIFEDLLEKRIPDFPAYHGGEFYASAISVVKTLMKDFYIVWEKLLKRHSMGLEKLHEEAHVLSYLFYKNNIKGGSANKFIKRLWTDPTTYRNIEEEDANLLIWHLPAEKRKGLKKFFHWLKSINFDTDNNVINNSTFQKRIRKTFLIPLIPVTQKPYYAAKFLAKKIGSLVK